MFLYGTRLAQLLRQDWDLVYCWEEPFILSAAQVAWWAPRKAPLVFVTFQNCAKHYPPPSTGLKDTALDVALAGLRRVLPLPMCTLKGTTESDHIE